MSLKLTLFFRILFCTAVLFIPSKAAAASAAEKVVLTPAYEAYLHCLERVYETMNENYYRPVSRELFERFVKKFDKNIYGKLNDKTKTSNFVCWRSAAYLVDQLKDQEDTLDRKSVV